ncbi:PREDICTED: OCIA domain-containing protein 1 isoform X1 [Papilio xuthus]|uniref:OCIA domain-containing protein 1 isoform X1 n=1 Tax=Papilio xuthus TaxID=66420 RepID=A0AAJ7E4H7_PAPXU|nr:PREDICTED: OCIA domain-containing protein 1 isoform X1 [Papilio xuthus]
MSGTGKKEDEEDCSCYAESHSKKTCPPVHNVTHPLRYYEFTQEEIKALEECDKESFYHRCLPFSTLFATLTYAAIRNGHLRPNPRFGAFPKVTLAVVMGYFIGKLSYQQACAEKLMALPGSYIGQILRDRRDGRTGIAPPPSNQSTSMLGASPSDIYSDAGPGNSLDLDIDRPLFSDDTYRPYTEAPANPPDTVPPRPSLSYDDLRRKNRGEFTDARQDPYKVNPNLAPPVTRPRPPPPAPPASSPTNKYGDQME